MDEIEQGKRRAEIMKVLLLITFFHFVPAVLGNEKGIHGFDIITDSTTSQIVTLDECKAIQENLETIYKPVARSTSASCVCVPMIEPQ